MKSRIDYVCNPSGHADDGLQSNIEHWREAQPIRHQYGDENTPSPQSGSGQPQ